jgi:hypothetical protein
VSAMLLLFIFYTLAWQLGLQLALRESVFSFLLLRVFTPAKDAAKFCLPQKHGENASVPARFAPFVTCSEKTF